MIRTISPEQFQVDAPFTVIDLPVLLIFDVPFQPAAAALVRLTFHKIEQENDTVLLSYQENDELHRRLVYTHDVAEMIELADDVYAVNKMGENDGSRQMLTEINFNEDYEPSHHFAFAGTQNSAGDFVLCPPSVTEALMDDFRERTWTKY